jgi:uncharacterized protein (DUF1778 family)
MTKQRIQVYADPEIKRRIELAAHKRDTPVTQYCLDAIIQQLADDEVLEARSILIDIKPDPDDTLLDEMRALREEILARRRGEMITADIVEQVRSERDDELINMR